MQGMLAAELAVLFQFNAVGVVLFVLFGVIIPLLALLARKDYLGSVG
jgi:hypothetical protein